MGKSQDQELHKLEYEIALRELNAQKSSLAEIRVLAGTVLTTGTIVAGVVAAGTVFSDREEVAATATVIYGAVLLGLGLLLVTVGTTMAWAFLGAKFNTRTKAFMACGECDRQPSLAEVYQRLAKEHRKQLKVIRKAFRKRWRIYGAGLFGLMMEILGALFLTIGVAVQ